MERGRPHQKNNLARTHFLFAIIDEDGIKQEKFFNDRITVS
jgi:hypothetical protein